MFKYAWKRFLLLPEELIDAGLSGFLVFQQLVGDTAVGRNDINPAVHVVRVTENDIVDDLRKPGHGGSADFFDAGLGFQDFLRLRA